jgi:hypothetical protein
MREYLTGFASQAKAEVLHNTFQADSGALSRLVPPPGREGEEEEERLQAGGHGCLRKWSRDCCPPMSSVTVTCCSFGTGHQAATELAAVEVSLPSPADGSHCSAEEDPQRKLDTAGVERGPTPWSVR